MAVTNFGNEKRARQLRLSIFLGEEISAQRQQTKFDANEMMPDDAPTAQAASGSWRAIATHPDSQHNAICPPQAAWTCRFTPT